MNKYVMALDQGTTSSRCILFGRDGAVRSVVQREFEQIFPQPGWVEHNPMDIWSSQISVDAEAMGRIGAAPEDVPEEMAELLAELPDVDDKNLLTAAAYFHAKFENIHAFADGNGRVGRLAMNYFLVLHNHPPITIHEEDRRDYFEALEKWDEAQELKPLTEYLCEQLIKTWRKG